MAVSVRQMITLLLVCGLLHSAAATIYNVGGDAGWTLQTANSTFYDDQFKDLTLFVGDSLNFSFATGAHNVVMVPEANLATCDSTTGAILSADSATIITPQQAETLGFLCDFPQHCSEYGMHFKATFLSTGPAPAPTSPAVPPPAVTSNVQPPPVEPSKAVLVRSESAMLVAAVLVAACGVLVL